MTRAELKRFMRSKSEWNIATERLIGMLNELIVGRRYGGPREVSTMLVRAYVELAPSERHHAERARDAYLRWSRAALDAGQRQSRRSRRQEMAAFCALRDAVWHLMKRARNLHHGRSLGRLMGARILNFAVQAFPGVYDDLSQQIEEGLAAAPPEERAKMRERMGEIFEMAAISDAQRGVVQA